MATARSDWEIGERYGIQRKAIETILRLCEWFPTVAVTGLPHLGKTTLAHGQEVTVIPRWSVADLAEKP